MMFIPLVPTTCAVTNYRSAVAIVQSVWWPLCRHICPLRPSLNKKVFPVHWPGGPKRADWDFFFMIFEKTFIFSQSSWYILVNEKLKTENKKIPTSRLPFWQSPGGQETIFYLRVALVATMRTQSGKSSLMSWPDVKLSNPTNKQTMRTYFVGSCLFASFPHI